MTNKSKQGTQLSEEKSKELSQINDIKGTIVYNTYLYNSICIHILLDPETYKIK